MKVNEAERRYDWLETAVGNKYGRVNKCKDAVYKLEAYRAPWALVNCEYCVCTCVSDNVQINRYFSLVEVTSDTINNK